MCCGASGRRYGSAGRYWGRSRRQSAGGRIDAVNDTGRRILPFRLEAPVGRAVIRTDVPSLANNAATVKRLARLEAVSEAQRVSLRI